MSDAGSGASLMLNIGDVDFCVQRQGSEPRAVFLHGFAGDLHTWDSIWPALGAALPVLRYDLRGFGRSLSRGDAPFDHADDLLAILDALHIPQCDVIGVSMGGGIALNFALDYPERVRNLVLISPALVGWEWSQAWRALWRPIAESARAGDMNKARRLWWQHPLFASTRDSAAGPLLYESIMRFSGEQWLRDNQRHRLPDVERLFQLKARTLLLTGGRDTEDFRLIADLIEGSVTDLVRVDFPGLGHLLHLEDAGACTREILSFLSPASR